MIVVFDIDGVLADVSHREHHITGRPKDWDAFFAEVGSDEVIESGRRRLLAEAVGHEVVLLSGRPERCRAATEEWLDRNGMAGYRLILRSDRDRRPAATLKADLIRALGSPQDIALVIDDDDSVVDRLRELGYHCEQFVRPLT